MLEWLNWWHKRKDHIFRAFKPEDTPNTNLAEIGHAQLHKVCDGKKVNLLHGCRLDVACAVRQDKMLKAMQTGEVNLGRGPSKKDLQEMSHKRQMQKAKSWGNNLSGSEDTESASGSQKTTAKRKRKVQGKADTGVTPAKKRKGNVTVSAKHRHELPPLSAQQCQTQKDSPFVLHRRHGTIRKCHGCENPLEATMEEPNDLILKKMDFREYKKDGMWYRQTFPCHTYYDLSMACVRLKYPSVQLSSIVILDDTPLTRAHVTRLHNIGIHKKCKGCNK